MTPDDLSADPFGVARRLLTAGIYGLTDVEVRVAERRCVVLWLTLEPWAEMALHGYPVETVSITALPHGYIGAIPLGAERRWLHRNRTIMGELCLWDPADSRSLRWEPEDGLVSYITIVHRHLQSEECWRRHQRWPAEDAPHGSGIHPIISAAMRRVALRAA